jgi:hypothetical protein
MVLGGKNRVFFYGLFGSFLQYIDIDEVNKILAHCASENDNILSFS